MRAVTAASMSTAAGAESQSAGSASRSAIAR